MILLHLKPNYNNFFLKFNREHSDKFYRMFSIFICFIVFSPSLIFSQKHINFDSLCFVAYTDASRMKIVHSKKIMNEALEINPNNLAYKFVENYADLIYISVNSNKQLFDLFKINCSERIDAFEKCSDKSPYKKAFLSELYLQRAIGRLIYNEKIRASIDIRASELLIEENKNEYPNFKYNYKLSGILNLILASIPDNLKWAASLVSLNGSIDKGIREIELYYYFVKNDTNFFCFYPEAICLKVATIQVFDPIAKALNKPKVIFNQKEFKEEVKLNKLLLFVCTDYMMKNGMNDEAISFLLNQEFDDSFLSFDYLDYITGIALQNKLDARAPKYFFKYVLNSKNRNYVKASYQRIAWNYLLNSNTEKYKEYILNVLSFGLNISESDNVAQDEANSGIKPNIILLKSRLLFDGGYYDSSLDVIKKFPFTNVINEENIEYAYRLGRIYHEKGDIEKALHYYNIVISQASKQPWFYAANSCLMAGLLCELNNKADKALFYYEACLKLDPEKYKVSIHQKAKAGKNRILK